MSFYTSKRYKFFNKATGSVIADSQGKLVAYKGTDYPDQYWFILNFGDKGYKLMNSSRLGEVIADSNGTLVSFAGEDYPDQYWDILSDGNGTYQFRCKGNNRSVIADSSGNLVAFTGQDYPDQHWFIREEEKITYDFHVNVISGSLKGKEFNGFFSYNPLLLTGKGKETITVQEAEFNYLSKYTHKDGIPSISFTDGNFEKIIWVSGKSTERFGFNDGFNRTQFGRDEEAFIREGKDYFGYLDKNNYVDGAGKIVYVRH